MIWRWVCGSLLHGCLLMGLHLSRRRLWVVERLTRSVPIFRLLHTRLRMLLVLGWSQIRAGSSAMTLVLFNLR